MTPPLRRGVIWLLLAVVVIAGNHDETDASLIDTAATRLLALEHVYCDPMTDVELSRRGSGALVLGSPPSMVAKARCKGASCPPLDGQRVVLEGCRWASVNNKVVYVEETSGWYHFYLDAERTLPLRPTEEEVRGVHSGEVGYLRNRCGSMRYRVAS